MKKILYICMCAMLAGLGIFVASCTKDPYVESTTSQSQDAYLSVEEARTFFEDSFTEQQTRSAGENTKKFLDPGEFTPQWEDAATSQNNALGSVDIPIMAQYKYRAIRSEFKKGKAKAYIVDMPQKLVVVKSKKTKAKAQYVLTLIPDKEYYEKNKNLNIIKRFLNSGDKDEFSGYALYSFNNSIVKMSKYKDGAKCAGASIIGSKNREERNKHLESIIRGLRNMKFQKQVVIAQTRSGGETEYWGCAACGDPGCDGYSCEDPIVVTPDYCGGCGEFDWACTCGQDNTCSFCGNDPCSCNDDLFCPECGSMFCNGECMNSNNGCDYCGSEWCSGECQNQGCDYCGDTYCGGECQEPDACTCGCCSECGYCGVCSSCDPPEPEPEPEIPDPCEDLTQEGILDASTNHEGGFVDHPDDPGGATNRGIAWDTWQANAMPVLGVEPTLENLKSLTEEGAKEIYVEKYWNKARIDEIDDPDMQYAVFDFYINSPAGAGRAIQNAVNELSGRNVLDVDGVIGPKTIEELNKMDHQDVYNLFLDNRKQHYLQRVQDEPASGVFLNGWLNRTNSFGRKTETQLYNVNC